MPGSEPGFISIKNACRSQLCDWYVAVDLFLDGCQALEDVVFDVLGCWFCAAIPRLLAPVFQAAIIVPDAANMCVALNSGIPVRMPFVDLWRSEAHEIRLDVMKGGVKKSGASPVRIGRSLKKLRQRFVVLCLLSMSFGVEQTRMPYSAEKTSLASEMVVFSSPSMTLKSNLYPGKYEKTLRSAE